MQAQHRFLLRDAARLLPVGARVPLDEPRCEGGQRRDFVLFDDGLRRREFLVPKALTLLTPSPSSRLRRQRALFALPMFRAIGQGDADVHLPTTRAVRSY